jgi:hypothetical protein
MKNFWMKVLRFFEMAEADYNMMPCHYDMDMYLWF